MGKWSESNRLNQEVDGVVRGRTWHEENTRDRANFQGSKRPAGLGDVANAWGERGQACCVVLVVV